MPLPPPSLDLLPLIPLSARTILDARCGDGSLWAAYRPTNPRARLLGIAANEADAILAGQHMEVAVGDAETDKLPFEVPDGIDCIVYDGVLEHASDPFAVLSRHAAQLNPDGVIVMRMTTPTFWRLAHALLHGEVAEVPRHRFTWHEMSEQLQRLGLSLCDARAEREESAEALGFINAMVPALNNLGIDPNQFAQGATAHHLVWRVRKEPRQRMLVAGTMLDPVAGVSDVRVLHPMRALMTDPSFSAQVTGDPAAVAREFGDAGRIFVFHRPVLAGAPGLKHVQVPVEAGYVVVTEFDDLPDHFGMMGLGGDLSFYGVHAVQTSTTALAERLREYNDEIAIFPNAIPALPPVRNFRDLPGLTVFFGALNRQADWAPLMPILNSIANLAGDRLRFEVVHDQDFFDTLETPHKRFTPICDWETYIQLLGQCEISFMPLRDTRFNRAKSDLKYVEASACRTAALASSVVYSDSIEDGRTGFIFRDRHELRTKLLRLVAMPVMARDMADAARAYVAEERMLAYQIGPRTAWYRSLWERRGELEAARFERIARRFQLG